MGTLTIVVITIVVVVVIVGVVELDTGCTERNDFPGVICLAHTRKLVAVPVKTPVAIIGDEHDVGANRLTLPRHVVAVDILCQSWSKDTKGEQGGSGSFHVGFDSGRVVLSRKTEKKGLSS